jgi:hypothetical protein
MSKLILIFVSQSIKNKTMKKTILALQIICLIGMVISEYLLFFKSTNNDQLITSMTLFLVFASVGTALIVLNDKLTKKLPN